LVRGKGEFASGAEETGFGGLRRELKRSRLGDSDPSNVTLPEEMTVPAAPLTTPLEFSSSFNFPLNASPRSLIQTRHTNAEMFRRHLDEYNS
jgi:hypothetical protein